MTEYVLRRRRRRSPRVGRAGAAAGAISAFVLMACGSAGPQTSSVESEGAARATPSQPGKATDRPASPLRIEPADLSSKGHL